MNLLQALHSRIVPSRGQIGQQQDLGRKPLCLSVLPPEIVLCMTRFLPTSSAACLALSSHHLFQVLGSKYWNSLRQCNASEREIFLTLLSRDLPAFFFCRAHDRSRLHLKEWIGPPAPGWREPRKLLPCIKDQTALTHNSQEVLSTYELRFVHVQLAMKRHRHGPEHGMPLEALSFTELQELHGADEKCTTLLSVEARVASDELLMRTQQWVLVPAQTRKNGSSKTSSIDLCLHIRALRHNTTYRVTASKPGHPGDHYEYPNCVGTHQCKQCAMEFEIGVQEVGNGGATMRITKWLNLGAGLTHLEPPLINHFSLFNGRPQGEISLGSIRSSFENEKGVSFDSLTQRNLSKLLEKRAGLGAIWYNHAWRQQNAYTWILEPTKPTRSFARGQIALYLFALLILPLLSLAIALHLRGFV